MTHRVYEKPGIYARATFEECEAHALRRGEAGWIMEYPNPSPYSTGWHYIISGREHYETQGFIVRANVVTRVELVGKTPTRPSSRRCQTTKAQKVSLKVCANALKG